jgi:hypothetical protein
MKSLILFALLGQVGDPKFRDIVEDWVIDRRMPVARMETVIGPDVSRMIRALGCEHYVCRKVAEDAIRRLPRDEFRRAMLLGRRHRDPEIAASCDRIYIDRTYCPHCLGTTECPNTGPPSYGHCGTCNWRRTCHACLGTGLRDPDLSSLNGWHHPLESSPPTD